MIKVITFSPERVYSFLKTGSYTIFFSFPFTAGYLAKGLGCPPLHGPFFRTAVGPEPSVHMRDLQTWMSGSGKSQ